MKQLLNKYKWVLLFFVLIIGSRFYNLERNFKFNRDESSDLVKIHQYWVDKKLSLIGPISEDGNLVYSSLSYYLEMPFAVLFDFNLVSPTIGNAFWSVVTALLMIYFLFQKNGRVKIVEYLLILVWYPLLIVSRWAWNPNLIPLMMIAGTILLEYRQWWTGVIGGVILGLGGHLHYLAIIPSGIIGIFHRNRFWVVAGLLIPIMVFIVFDLIHPPGLFITRALLFKQGQMGFNLGSILVGIEYIIGSWINSLAVFLLLINDIRHKRKVSYLWWAIGGLVLAICFLKKAEEHYFIGAIIPFWCWLMLKRDGLGNYLKYGIVVLLIITSIPKSLNLVFGDIPDDSAYSAEMITNTIRADIDNNGLKNANLVVLKSNDINSFGVKYRDLLLVKNSKIKSVYEFETTDNLYVITQTNNIENLRSDNSVQMSYFRNGPVRLQKEIQDTGWWVFRFDRY